MNCSEEEKNDKGEINLNHSHFKDEKHQKEKKTIAKLEEEIDSLKKERLRLLADKENERKSYKQWLIEGQKYANEKLIKDIILPFLDNYERAVSSKLANEDAKVKNILEGLQMILTSARELLQKEGITEIKITPQKDFWSDQFHEVIEEEESDNFPPGTILEVLQKGYLIHQRVLVPVKVKISKEKSIIKN